MKRCCIRRGYESGGDAGLEMCAFESPDAGYGKVVCRHDGWDTKIRSNDCIRGFSLDLGSLSCTYSRRISKNCHLVTSVGLHGDVVPCTGLCHVKPSLVHFNIIVRASSNARANDCKFALE